MTARGNMTHRAVVTRNSASGEDSLGQPVAPVFATHATIACKAWSSVRREVVDEEKVIEIETIKMRVASDADIAEDTDRIERIENRKDTPDTLFAGPLKILAIQRRPGHKIILLERFKP